MRWTVDGAKGVETMSYVNAPATEMVATHCACCGKDLVDAVSVETGVGPDCRKKHGYADAQGEADTAACLAALATFPDVVEIVSTKSDAQAQANCLVHRIAMEQTGERVSAMTAAIAALGFTRLAARIAKRVGVIEVTVDGSLLRVKAPYSEEFNAAVRAVPGVRSFKVDRTFFRTVPQASRRALWNALKKSFPVGTMVQGPRGLAAL